MSEDSKITSTYQRQHIHLCFSVSEASPSEWCYSLDSSSHFFHLILQVIYHETIFYFVKSLLFTRQSCSLCSWFCSCSGLHLSEFLYWTITASLIWNSFDHSNQFDMFLNFFQASFWEFLHLYSLEGICLLWLLGLCLVLVSR